MANTAINTLCSFVPEKKLLSESFESKEISFEMKQKVENEQEFEIWRSEEFH